MLYGGQRFLLFQVSERAALLVFIPPWHSYVRLANNVGPRRLVVADITSLDMRQFLGRVQHDSRVRGSVPELQEIAVRELHFPHA